ncbi:MAG: cytochrome c3 family protein [Coriobacteriales bacterium]|nr:cytochrome c3 family protein [Coriobacteriales bacterium]
MGEDISSFTEVSKENCGNSDCHGDWSTIKADTEGALFVGNLVANPHDNHQTTEIECSDCHSLTEASTLYCWSCHTYELSRDNGTWGTR